MKTANKILEECAHHSFNFLTNAEVRAAMKIYAKQVAEQALKDAYERIYTSETAGLTIKESILSTPIITP